MIPALAVSWWTECVYLQFEGRVELRGMRFKLIVRTQVQPVFKFCITDLSSLPQHPIQSALEASYGRAMIGAPVAKPDGSWIVSIHCRDHKLYAILGIVVSGHCAFQQLLRFRIARIVLNQIRVALPIGLHHRADNSQAGPLRISILPVPRHWTICNNSFDI